MKKESGIQEVCLDYLRGNKKKQIQGVGGWWLNFHGGDPYMPRGLPDIVGCYRGRFVAFEVKRPGEAPRKIQHKVMRTLKAAGALTAVVYSVEDVKRAIRKEETP